MLFIGETGRKLADSFCEHLMGIHKEASKVPNTWAKWTMQSLPCSRASPLTMFWNGTSLVVQVVCCKQWFMGSSSMLWKPCIVAKNPPPSGVLTQQHSWFSILSINHLFLLLAFVCFATTLLCFTIPFSLFLKIMLSFFLHFIIMIQLSSHLFFAPFFTDKRLWSTQMLVSGNVLCFTKIYSVFIHFLVSTWKWSPLVLISLENK